jgi:hypothetical protein
VPESERDRQHAWWRRAALTRSPTRGVPWGGPTSRPSAVSFSAPGANRHDAGRRCCT